MALRKCTASEAYQAAVKYGCKDEHELKSHIVGSYYSVSESDVFIEPKTGEIFIANKNGSNPQSTGIRL